MVQWKGAIFWYFEDFRASNHDKPLQVAKLWSISYSVWKVFPSCIPYECLLYPLPKAANCFQKAGANHKHVEIFIAQELPYFPSITKHLGGPIAVLYLLVNPNLYKKLKSIQIFSLIAFTWSQKRTDFLHFWTHTYVLRPIAPPPPPPQVKKEKGTS